MSAVPDEVKRVLEQVQFQCVRMYTEGFSKEDSARLLKEFGYGRRDLVRLAALAVAAASILPQAKRPPAPIGSRQAPGTLHMSPLDLGSDE